MKNRQQWKNLSSKLWNTLGHFCWENFSRSVAFIIFRCEVLLTTTDSNFRFHFVILFSGHFCWRQWLEGIFPGWNRSLFCRKTLFRVIHNFRFNSKWKTPIIQGWIKKIIHFEFRELITLLKLVRILLLEISLNWIRFGTERCEL